MPLGRRIAFVALISITILLFGVELIPMFPDKKISAFNEASPFTAKVDSMVVAPTTFIA